MSYKEKSLYERIIDRDGKLVKERNPFDAQRLTIVENFRYDLTINLDDKGNFTGTDIIEGTPPWALGVMTKGFVGSMLGRNVEWLRYAMRELFFKGIDEVNQWLQNLEEQMYWEYRNSNYYDIMPKYVKDGLSIGSPVTMADEDVKSGRTIFTVPHYTENYVAQNWLGEDDTYHRSGKWSMSVKQLFEQFKKEDLSITIQDAMENGRHYDLEPEVIMAIYNRDDPIFDDLKEEDQKYKPTHDWMQYYILRKTDAEKQRPLFSKQTNSAGKGYFTRPFSVWHYDRQDNESYARTPAWYAIFDAKGSNAAWATAFELGEQEARPAMWMMQNMKGRQRFAPGGNNYALTEQDYARPPVPLRTGGNYDVNMDFIGRLGLNVERHFFVNLFQMIEQFNREHKQPPTAFQIFEMLGEKSGQLIPAVQTFEGGVLKSNDDRMMDIADRAGRLPPIPPIVADYAAANNLKSIAADPQFTGPLSQAQRRHLGVQRVHQGLAAVAPILEQWPNAKFKIREAKLTEKVLENMNFPQDCIVPEEEYEEEMAELARMEQEDRQLDQAERIAKSIPSVSKDVESDSPLAQLTGSTA